MHWVCRDPAGIMRYIHRWEKKCELMVTRATFEQNYFASFSPFFNAIAMEINY